MPKTDPRSSNKSSSTTANQDAFALLTADHKRVKSLFKEFESLKDEGDNDRKASFIPHFARSSRMRI
jgi:hypothetical protein